MIFNVVVAYEDFDAARRAAKMIERLQYQLRPAIRIAAESWKFELIGDSRLRALATEAAQHSDMLVLALTDGSDLPFYMKQWLEAWALLEHDEPVALVTLHNLVPCYSEVPPLRAYLQRLAEHGHLDLFWYGEDAVFGNSPHADLTASVMPTLVSCNGRTTTSRGELAIC